HPASDPSPRQPLPHPDRPRSLTVRPPAVVLGAFRESAQQYRTLPELAASLERSVRRHLSELTRIAPDSSERFITALLIELPDDEEIASVVSCGHPPPLLHQGSRLTLLPVTQPAPPLGLSADTPHAFCLDTVAFGPGDTLLLYTDGLAEARDSAGRFFPVLERAETWTWDCPSRLVQHISVDVDRHAGKNLQDDLALVAVHHPTHPAHSEQAPP
ncbi:PP2C family protein-serine/threonine phosphatase, partial [Streptomyces sp. NPDC048342]|uniref:PP2C family protein-serine/threonine phosphatase n=1 Tax=unclassified Streptomyces TaxID=2593676 RepID=UPI003413ACBA